MKKLKIFLTTILAAGTLCSCDDWLTVVPDGVLEADKLVQTDEGISGTLNGIYILLSRQTYNPSGVLGGSSIPERMGASYNSGSLASALGDEHIYPVELESTNTDLFWYVYGAIANCNALLNGMEKFEAKLNKQNYNMVRGEALAIRALLHFELICVYGPVPNNPDPGKSYLPYVKTNDISPYTYNTFDEFMGMTLEDLNQAELLLRDSDPLILASDADAATFASYMHRRKGRVNYYGVLGLQARVRHYLGRTDGEDGSVAYAKKVIAVSKESVNTPFRLTTAADFADGAEFSHDRTYYSEHLSGINCSAYDIYISGSTPYLAWNPNAVSWGVTGAVDQNEFIGMMTKGLGVATTDIRYNKPSNAPATSVSMIHNRYRSMAAGGPLYTTGKWMAFSSLFNSPRNFPIVRLAEMYFVVMEAGTLSEANQLYEEYCTARSTGYAPLTESDRAQVLLDEFIREFYGESKNFMRYKRTGERNMWFSLNPASEESYRLPLPEREISTSSANQ